MESRANRFAEASGDSSPHQRRRWDCCLSWPAAESGSHGPGRLGGRRGRCFVDAGASALGQLGPPRASASGRLHNSEATSPSSAGASASETRGRLLKGQLERYQLAPPALNVRRAFAAGRRPMRQSGSCCRFGSPGRARRTPSRAQDDHGHPARTGRVGSVRPHAGPTEERNLAHASNADERTRALQQTMFALLTEQLAAKRLTPSAGERPGYRPPLSD